MNQGSFGMTLAVLAALCACGPEGSATSSSAASGASSSAPAPVPEAGVAITKRFPAVGDKITKVIDKRAQKKSDLEGPLGARKANETESHSEERIEECLAVRDTRCTKARVTYRKATKKVTSEDGTSEEPTLPHLGKSYVVEVTERGVAITDEAGQPPPANELSTVEGDYKRFGRDGELLDALRDRLNVGDSLDEVGQVLSARFADAEKKPTKLETKVTVKAVRSEGGRQLIDLDFSIQVEGVAHKDGVMVSGSVTGLVTIRADTGRSQRMETKASMVAVLDGQNTGNVRGQVASETTETTTYSYSF